MIRREEGADYLLIAQHDHALIAGELASHVGNDRFAPPNPYEEVVAGVRLHEAASTRSPSTSTMHARQLPSGR